MKPRGERPKLSKTKATVTIGGATFEVVGRTAQLVGLIALHEKRVNAPDAGKLVLHFGGGQAKLELREVLPALWLQPN